jgi:RimJ/RimL family protein N-acetyltransferase
MSDETYRNIILDIMEGGTKIGVMSLLVDDDSTYIERIDIDEAHRNRGYGTEAIRLVADEYDETFAAADNEDAARLYSRIGVKTNEHQEIDQGFGVWFF